MLRNEFAVMGLFAKVEVGIDGVLQQMHHAVARHDEHRPERRVRIELQPLGHHLQHGGGHQETRAQCDKVAQVTLDTFGAHQHQPASHIGQRGNRAEKK